jgi:hypothetical protein
MSNILQFPDKFRKEPRHYRIPLYTDEDINVVLFCLNAFGNSDKRIIFDDLLELDPIDVMECLDFAVESDMISTMTKEHIHCIRKSVEES